MLLLVLPKQMARIVPLCTLSLTTIKTLGSVSLWPQVLDSGKTPGQFLERLQLNKCYIPEGGGMLIATALKAGNKRLRVLGMANNFLGNSSAGLFGEVMEANHTLLELDLSWNQIKVRKFGGRDCPRWGGGWGRVSRGVSVWGSWPPCGRSGEQADREGEVGPQGV